MIAFAVDVQKQHVADFDAVGKNLIGGNLNNDSWTDIYDSGIIVGEYGKCYGAGAPDGNTNCSTPKPHADISGNGLVWTENFTFITNKFLGKSEPNCCPTALGTVAGDDYGPVTRISVKELRRLDLYDMIAADLNGDGWVDEQDIEAFMDGARPAPEGTKGKSRTGSGIR